MDTRSAAGTTAAVVALKLLRHAKSRLHALPDPLRRQLAWTMALDTVAALSEAVDRVLVVSDEPGLAAALAGAGVRAEVLPEDGSSGMNPALERGARQLGAGGAAVVLACVGDLPALRPQTVHAVLAASEDFPRSFVADHLGRGTTMLVARQAELAPHFGPGSAAAHAASGAARLNERLSPAEIGDALHDVDTEADLASAARLGLGRATGALVDPSTHLLGSYELLTVLAPDRAVNDRGRIRALGPDVLTVRPTASTTDHAPTAARLHAVVSAGRVLSAWSV